MCGEKTELQISEDLVNLLTLSRHLYFLASESLRSRRTVSLFAAANLLQDSVEVLLWAALRYLKPHSRKNQFEQIFDQISECLSPSALPRRDVITQLNKIRVNSKHYGIRPHKYEMVRLGEHVREFLGEATGLIFPGVDYWRVSLVDLVEKDEVRGYLKDAEQALERGNFSSCLIECRKALFLTFEWKFDVSPFSKEPYKPGGGLLGSPFISCNAPTYARNPAYIKEHVSEPTDHIVYDHDALNMELLRLGVDNTTYWNVWRLTPEVFRPYGNDGSDWAVSEDLDLFEADGLQARAEYVFQSVCEIVLTVDAKQRADLHRPSVLHSVVLKQDQVSVYKKADRKSELVGTTPPGVMELIVSRRVQGLCGDGHYYQVMNMPGVFSEEDVSEGVKRFLFGYVHEETVSDLKTVRSLRTSNNKRKS